MTIIIGNTKLYFTTKSPELDTLFSFGPQQHTLSLSGQKKKITHSLSNKNKKGS